MLNMIARDGSAPIQPLKLISNKCPLINLQYNNDLKTFRNVACLYL